jgi:hypothetical protein
MCEFVEFIASTDTDDAKNFPKLTLCKRGFHVLAFHRRRFHLGTNLTPPLKNLTDFTINTTHGFSLTPTSNPTHALLQEANAHAEGMAGS